MIATYTAIPHTATAARLTPDTLPTILEWSGGHTGYQALYDAGHLTSAPAVIIPTPDGPIPLRYGEWLVRRGGRFEAMAHQRFTAAYDEAE